MKKQTVLILAYECYPYNRSGSAIGAQRPYQFAKHLADSGWHVIVLCCDREQRRSLEKKQLSVTVNKIIQQHTSSLQSERYTVIPLPSLEADGWADYMWAKTTTQGAGDTYIGKGFPFSLIRKLSTVYKQLVEGDYSWSWIPVAEQAAAHLIKEYKVNLILGEHSPDAGIILADKLSRRYQIPWLADFRDPALRFFSGTFARLYSKRIKRIVSSATSTIAVSEAWSRLDEELFEKKSHVVLNGYDQELIAQTPAHEFPAFTVSYFGSFDQGFQDILPSLRAFRTFLDQHEQGVPATLFYRGLADKAFLAHCSACGIPSAHLDVGGFCDRAKATAYMKGSQVLLIYGVDMTKTTNKYERVGVYPGKVFEYLGTGKPILLIPTDHGMLGELINTTPQGKATEAVQEATTFIEEQYRQWQMNGPVSLNSSNEQQVFYSRKTQVQQLDRILKAALSQ